MELFGQSISGSDLVRLIGLLMALAFWMFVLRNERRHTRWLSDALERRNAKKQARNKPSSEDSDPTLPKGPWG